MIGHTTGEYQSLPFPSRSAIPGVPTVAHELDRCLIVDLLIQRLKASPYSRGGRDGLRRGHGMADRQTAKRLLEIFC